MIEYPGGGGGGTETLEGGNADGEACGIFIHDSRGSELNPWVPAGDSWSCPMCAPQRLLLATTLLKIWRSQQAHMSTKPTTSVALKRQHHRSIVADFHGFGYARAFNELIAQLIAREQTRRRDPNFERFVGEVVNCEH
jgi:hypothetical protein